LDNFKPMLACEANLSILQFPILASVKLDGVRAVVRDGIVYSRSNKPIPNRYVQEKFSHLERYDGELIWGEPTAPDCYRQTVSAVMGYEHDTGRDVQFYVFDHIGTPEQQYRHRVANLTENQDMKILKQVFVESLPALQHLEESVVEQGHEGLILRDPAAPYKFGRSTRREGYLLKLKRFSDDEALVVGYEELMHNENTPVINELGRQARSSHATGKVAGGRLGALQVVSTAGIAFNIGTGFTASERASLWEHRESLIGKRAKYKYFSVGVKDAPRHPVFLGWREED
jgi:DNA ligase 1